MAVTVTTGKTASRYSRVLFGGVNLSGDARTIGSVGVTYAEVDVTGWSGTVMEYLLDTPVASFGPFQAVMNNNATAVGPVEAGSHTTLSAVGQPIATFVQGIREAPTIGAPAFSLLSNQKSYTATAQQGGTILIDADFGGYIGMTYTPKFGVALGVGTTVSDTTNFGSVDNGGSSANGAIAVLHVTQSVGAMAANSWAIKLQDSANDSDWADLITFTADGSAVAAEYDDTTITSTVDQYTRLQVTKSAGTDIVCWAVLIRL